MAIILRQRPIVDVAAIPPAADAGSPDILARAADTLRRAAGAIGQLRLGSTLSPDRAGSAFLVGDRLAILARYSAEAFITGVGDSDLQIDRGSSPVIDFSSSSADGPVIPIVDARFVHPYFDLALVGLAENPPAAPLALEAVRPLQLAGRDVCIIGFPQPDPRSDPDDVAHVARSALGGKKVQPGTVRGLSHYQHHGLPRVSIAHDCSTLGGNSGSPVLDPTSGRVLGVHFAGQAGVQNFAVPAWELGRDIRLRNAGIGFSEPLCPWAHLWNERVARPEAIPGSYVRQQGNRFVFYVDGRQQGEVAYDRNKRQALHQLLLEVFQPAARIRDFIAELPGAGMVEHDIPWDASAATVVLQTIGQLEARGLLDREFFERLSRRAQLRSIVARWIESLWSNDEGAVVAVRDAGGAPREAESEPAVRAEAETAQCGCHRWPASFDEVRRRIVPIANLDIALQRASALALVKLEESRPEDSRGLMVVRTARLTGFLIDPNWILLSTLPEAGGRRYEVQSVSFADGDVLAIRDEGVVVDPELGWTLVPLPASSARSPAVLRQGPLQIGEPVSLVYHLGGHQPHVSFRDSAVVSASEETLRYVVSPSAGTYGCPVFDADWQVVALNCARNQPGAAPHTIRCMTGVPIQRILDAIAKRGIVLKRTVPEPPTPEPPAGSGPGGLE
jgi:hypothetical protein